MSMGACLPGDPGWHYMSSEGKAIQDDGLRYELPEASGASSRVYGSLFAGTLDVELDIRNTMDQPLEINMRGLTVETSKGNKLRRRIDLPTARCGGKTNGDLCLLTRDQACRLAARFQAQPFAAGIGGWLGERNPDLREITVSTQPSPRRAAASEVELRVQLVWME